MKKKNRLIIGFLSCILCTGLYSNVNAAITEEASVRWIDESYYENYNEIEISEELKDALIIPDNPKSIKIMAAKDKKGFLYLLYRMPAVLKFEPVSGKPVNTKEISAVISKDCDISEKEFKVQIFQTTVSEGNISKIVDEVSVSFNDEYYLDENVAESVCASLEKNVMASKVYYRPAFYNSAQIEVNTYYPLEYSKTISEILKKNNIESEVKTTEESSEHCNVVIMNSYEDVFKAIELIYSATGLRSSVSAFADGSSVTLPSEIEVLYSDNIVTGDIDLNGKIDVTDITELSLALLGDKELTKNQQRAADIDGDGAVTLADLARLQQYLSKKITSF
jgi:hypothetical protein